MILSYLGHASWLAELGRSRVLFDPLIDGRHHGDVFEVDPPRRVDVGALAPDYLVVSHAHGDHFDLPSLRAIALHDPEIVAFTSDELVASALRRVGFSTVERVDTWTTLELDGARVLTTPSHAEGETEWGAMLVEGDVAVWNQIDSYHPELEQVADTLARSSALLGLDVTRGLPLALVRWQPVLETQACLGRAAGFPFTEYAMSLGRIAAIGAQAVVPAAAGVRQRGAFAWLNHYVYPVPHRRVMRDIPLRAPGTRVLPPTIGATYGVSADGVQYDERGARGLVEPLAAFDPMRTLYRPYELPRLVDPNLEGASEPAMRATITEWVEGRLARALGAVGSSVGPGRPMSFVLEVVLPSTTDAWTLSVDASGVRVQRGFDDDYDVLNSVAGSLLCDVLAGRRQWGDPLLGGALRGSVRAYDLDETGLLPSTVEPTFVYYGLPYAESLRSFVEHELVRLGC